MLKGWEFASDNLNLESSNLIKDRQTRVYVTRLIDDLTLTSLQFRGGHFEFWIRDRLLRGLELNILRKPLGVRSVRDRMYRCLSLSSGTFESRFLRGALSPQHFYRGIGLRLDFPPLCRVWSASLPGGGARAPFPNSGWWSSALDQRGHFLGWISTSYHGNLALDPSNLRLRIFIILFWDGEEFYVLLSSVGEF